MWRYQVSMQPQNSPHPIPLSLPLSHPTPPLSLSLSLYIYIFKKVISRPMRIKYREIQCVTLRAITPDFQRWGIQGQWAISAHRTWAVTEQGVGKISFLYLSFLPLSLPSFLANLTSYTRSFLHLHMALDFRLWSTKHILASEQVFLQFWHFYHRLKKSQMPNLSVSWGKKTYECLMMPEISLLLPGEDKPWYVILDNYLPLKKKQQKTTTCFFQSIGIKIPPTR